MPPTWSRLRNLVLLDLSANSLAGIIQSFIIDCSLTIDYPCSLHLHHEVTQSILAAGTLPSSYYALVNLSRIILDSNRLTGVASQQSELRILLFPTWLQSLCSHTAEGQAARACCMNRLLQALVWLACATHMHLILAQAHSALQRHDACCGTGTLPPTWAALENLAQLSFPNNRLKGASQARS